MSLNTIIFACIALSTAVAAKNERIIGGVDASVLDYPYHASLRRISDNVLICGGAIVSIHHILTTAHCVDVRYVNPENLMIVVGVSSASDLSGSSYVPQVIKVHPKYTGVPDPVTQCIYDIAVIKLKTRMQFSDYQTKVLLPIQNIHNGNIGVVTGWGATSCSASEFAGTMKQAWMTVIDQDVCKSKIQFPLQSDQFCAFQQPGIGVCKGDGGSPLVVNHRITGLVLASRPYATGEPEIYLNIFKHVEFVRSVIKYN